MAISFSPGWITAAIGTVLFIGTVWKFFFWNPFEDKLKEFNRRKDDLKGSRETLKTRMHKQLETEGEGKVVQADVKKWLDAADREISEDRSVEHLAEGVLYYLLPRYGIAKKRNAELKKTSEEGEKFRDMPPESLVEDDASLERFTRQKNKLEVKLEDVQGRLSSQLLRVPGKIETEEVKLWREEVKEIINGQAVKDIEEELTSAGVPQDEQLLEKVNSVGLVGHIWAVWKYLKKKLTGSNRRKQGLQQLREIINKNLQNQLETEGKVVRDDVKKWLDEADVEISQQQSVGIWSLCYRIRIVKKRTAELNKILQDGEKFRDMPLLVDDNASLEWLTKLKEKLDVKLGDVQGRLSSELVPWKIETKKVERWRENVEDIIKDIEEELNSAGVPQDEQLREKVDIIIAGEGNSETLGDGERQSFEEWKGKLQGKHGDVKEKLSTELDQNPEKIAAEHVKQWLQKVEGIIILAASAVHNQLSSGHPPYLAKELIQEMEELCNEGDQLLTESLVVYTPVDRVRELIRNMKKLHDEGDQLLAESLVSRVRELIRRMKELYNEGTRLPESLVIDPTPPMLVPELQGNHDVKAEILGHLRGDETSKIGVWGMTGVGKTTIMKHVYNQLLEERNFKKVIWVTVSETFGAGKIQDEIASSLQKDKILRDQQGGDLRAAAFSKILEMHKPYVLILDNVWETSELHKVGIPEIPGCKLVLTTQSKEVVDRRGCKLVKVNTLSTEDSLQLFKDTAGVVEFSDYERTLEEMVDECGGLPLAIKAVAASMKGETDPRLWRDALRQLKEGSTNVAGAEYDPFGALQFSYDRLENSNIKHCFLNCVLYPAMILKEDLIDCWIDGELIDVDGTLRVMKDKGHSILKKLVGNCLLESVRNYSGRDCVRMHDLMRTMALRITRTSDPRFLVKVDVGLTELREWDEWKGDLSKVSLMFNYITIVDIPPSLPLPRCQILTTLLLSDNWISTIPEHFFEHMPVLRVLDLSENRELRSLPSSVSELVKLTTLLLRGCRSLKKVPSLSKLISLTKLDLLGSGIEEVPHGIKKLLNLKYLDIRRGLLNNDISYGEVYAGWANFVSEILPTLSKLQHLGLSPKVPVEGEHLRLLTKLESFYGSVRTWSDMCILFSSGRQSLYHYNVSVGGFGENMSYELKSICCFDPIICGEPGLTLMPSDVQRLVLWSCNDVRSLDALSRFFGLQECEISFCREVEYVFSGLNQLPKLKRLKLAHLEKLKGLSGSEAAPQLAFFSSLEVISIISCPEMKKLFPTTWQNLPNLKEVSVKDCSELEEIMVASSSSSSEGRVIHAKLEKLTLKNLPMLKSISSLTAATVFDCLKELEISRCPNLNMEYIFRGQFKFSSLHSLETLRLAGLGSLKSIFHEEADESHAPTVPFPLKSIEVRGCPQLKKIFPHAVQIDSFQNLESIEVKGCKELEEIMAVSSEREEDQSKPILPKLASLYLVELPVLKRISSVSVVPDSLWELTIQDCPDLKWECLFSSRKLPQTLEFIRLKGVRDLELIYDDGEASDSLAFFRSASSSSPTSSSSSDILELIYAPTSSSGIWVENCPQLKRIFAFGRGLDSFQCLHQIEVKDCKELEEIMATSLELEENQSKPILPELVNLRLTRLPALRRLCSPTASLVLDSVLHLTIEDCPGLSWELPKTLKSLWLRGVENVESVFAEEAPAFWRLPPAATSTFALESITVANCPQLKRIFSHAGLLDYFQNIRKFEVTGCDELEEIISAKSEEESIKVTHLPKLREFKMRNLPKLKRVCTATSALICDSLMVLTISGCTDLKRFPLRLPQSDNGQLSPPPNLRQIELSDKEKEWWESLEWDQPNVEAVLLPLCIFKWEMKYQFSWTPPSPGYLKLNIGACKSQTQIASAGGLIRDSNGSWIKGFMVHLGDASVVTAELWGIRTGLAIARSLNITHLIVETDSTFVVNKLTSSTNMTDPVFTLINDYLGSRLCFKSCHVRQTRREVNVCADYIANEALLMPQGITYLENPPEGLRTLLWKDATGKSATHTSEEDFPGHRPLGQQISSAFTEQDDDVI